VPRRATVVVPANVTAGLLGLASAALLIAGVLLPWINVAGLGDTTLNLFQLGPEDSFSKYGTVLVLMGVVVALIGAARFVISTLWISVSSVGLGIGTIAIAFDRYRLLRTRLAQHPDVHKPPRRLHRVRRLDCDRWWSDGDRLRICQTAKVKNGAILVLH
jgi:hypothetical protein